MVVDSPQDSHWDWNTKLVHSQLTQSCKLSGAKMVSNGLGIEIQLMVKNWTVPNQSLPAALSAAWCLRWHETQRSARVWTLANKSSHE